MTKITIITPTYNDVQYIDNLLVSIQAQVNKNFHWLIIDDGSSINNKKILKQKIDDIVNVKVKVIYKKNTGVSDTRNFALEICSTEWVMFVDIDDSIDDDLIEEFYKSISNNRYKYKLLITNFKVKHMYNKKIFMLKINKKNLKFTFGSISNKIFLRKELKNCFNNNYAIGEDLDLFIRYTKKISESKIGLINSSFIWWKRKNSTIRNLDNGNYLDVVNMACRWSKNYDLKKKKNKYVLSAITEHAYIYTYIRFYMDKNKKINKQKYKKLKNNLYPKNIIITKRTFSLFILSVVFKIHCQFILIPFAKIYAKFYLSK